MLVFCIFRNISVMIAYCSPIVFCAADSSHIDWSLNSKDFIMSTFLLFSAVSKKTEDRGNRKQLENNEQS
jgi:hypothetical protein